VLEPVDIERPGVGIVELQQVDGREVARRVVEEHVLAARVAGVDAAGCRAGVPRVDRGVVLHARIGAAPCGVGDLVPQVAGLDDPVHVAVGAPVSVPVAVSSTALKNSSGIRTELLEFCPLTV
jgi:hypothetical protein